MTKRELFKALDAKRIIHAIACVTSNQCTCGYSALAEKLRKELRRTEEETHEEGRRRRENETNTRDD